VGEMVNIKEARKLIDELYPLVNVYDAYLMKKEWGSYIDFLENRVEAIKALSNIEAAIGISALEQQIDELEAQLAILRVSPLHYKSELPADLWSRVNEEMRLIKGELEELNEKLESKLNSTFIEEEIIYGKPKLD